MTLLPTRRADILTREVGLETVAVDTAANKAHALTPLASSVYALCDGVTTVEAAALTVGASVADVETAVISLTALGLVSGPGLTRRRALQRAGLVGAGALAVTIASPLAANAASARKPLYLDLGGSGDGTYQSATPYLTGSTLSYPASTTNSPSIDTSQDTTSDDIKPGQSVLQTVTYGNNNTSFSVSLPAGTLDDSSNYTVRLYLAEVYFGIGNNGGGSGSRHFTASTPTDSVAGIDIYQQAGGANKLILVNLTATSASDGSLIVTFTAESGGNAPAVNAIAFF